MRALGQPHPGAAPADTWSGAAGGIELGRVGSLQSAVFPALAARLFGADPTRRLLLLRAVWPHVVGPELARRCALVGLQRDVLRVRVPDAAWRKALLGMRGRVLARLGAVTGPLAPTRLAFVEAAVTDTPDVPDHQPVDTRPARGILELPAEIGQAAGSIQDEEIRAGFLRTAARALSRRALQES